MKHRLLLAASVMVLLIITGCQARTNPTTETTVLLQTVSTVATTPTTEPTEEAQPQILTGWDAAKNAFEKILWEEDIFFSHDLGEAITLTGYCAHMGTVAETNVGYSSYSLADLDADGVPELLLGIVFNDELAYGTLVLHYSEGVTGYEFTYRQLMDIKLDGTFRYSGGAADNGIARLRFTSDGWEYHVLGGVENSGEEVTYFWDGQPVDPDTYNTYADIYYFKSDAARTPYPGEAYTLTLPAIE